MVRWLHAELPRQLGRPREGLEALYDLFALAEQQLQRSLASGEPCQEERVCVCVCVCVCV